MVLDRFSKRKGAKLAFMGYIYNPLICVCVRDMNRTKLGTPSHGVYELFRDEILPRQNKNRHDLRLLTFYTIVACSLRQSY